MFDVTGRQIAQLAAGTYEPGSREAIWNGRDDSGRRVAPGMYMLRLATGVGNQVARITYMGN